MSAVTRFSDYKSNNEINNEPSKNKSEGASYMVKLESIVRQSQELNKHLHPNQILPDWIQDLIIKAESSVHDVLVYLKEEELKAKVNNLKK